MLHLSTKYALVSETVDRFHCVNLLVTADTCIHCRERNTLRNEIICAAQTGTLLLYKDMTFSPFVTNFSGIYMSIAAVQ